MSFTGSPPFAFLRATATPQSKSMLTCELDCTSNVKTTTAFSSPLVALGSPTSAVSPTFVCPEFSECTRYAHAPLPSSCCRWPTTPLNSAKSCFPYTSGSHKKRTIMMIFTPTLQFAQHIRMAGILQDARA